MDWQILASAEVAKQSAKFFKTGPGQSGQVTWSLRLSPRHGLIQGIPRPQRYQLTATGRRILPTFPAARVSSTQALRQIAA